MTPAAAVVKARLAVPAQVVGMHSALNSRGADAAASLAHDAIEELRSWSEVHLVMLDTETNSSCGISGVYRDDLDPPIIGIGASASTARAQFTALHELGHHLQQTDHSLIERLGEQNDRGAILEELACDQFAAEILIPRDLVQETLGAGTPTAAEIVALWRRTSASRAAICVAAAGRLQSPGHVILLNVDGTVEFCSSRTEYRLRRGSDQSDADVYRQFLRRLGGATVSSRSTRFAYRGGAFMGQELYAQATEMGGYLLVVAVSDGAPWEAISLPSIGPRLIARTRTCIHCGEITENGDALCTICGVAKCSECGRCECASAVVEKTCHRCFLVKPAHLFLEDGVICEECA